MKKVEILVQRFQQDSGTFAFAIDNLISSIAERGNVLDIQFTTASDGRQTCNIIYEDFENHPKQDEPKQNKLYQTFAFTSSREAAVALGELLKEHPSLRPKGLLLLDTYHYAGFSTVTLGLLNKSLIK